MCYLFRPHESTYAYADLLIFGDYRTPVHTWAPSHRCSTHLCLIFLVYLSIYTCFPSRGEQEAFHYCLYFGDVVKRRDDPCLLRLEQWNDKFYAMSLDFIIQKIIFFFRRLHPIPPIYYSFSSAHHFFAQVHAKRSQHPTHPPPHPAQAVVQLQISASK